MRRVFSQPNEPDIWIQDSQPSADKFVLITVSGSQGEQTVLVTAENSFSSKAKHFVQAPRERIIKGWI